MPGVAQAKSDWYQRGTSMAPRFQWNANDGYCGETSFISAGMQYGEYSSQWTVRALVDDSAPQWKASSQLLLGVNAAKAAREMRLTMVAFPSKTQRSTPQFLQWVKDRFLRGNVVIIGVYNNVTTLGEPASLADPDYDHIVPVMGIGSAHRLSDHRYYANDSIAISDNGLYNIGPNIPYLYEYRMGSFMRNRAQASAAGGPLYSLRETPPNYGVAVTGVVDTDGFTVPVRLTSSANGEGVQNQPRLTTQPTAFPITLTATVTLPDPTVAYNVYLYDGFGDVPRGQFNANAAQAMQSWSIPPGTSHTWKVTIDAMSSDTRVFRAVPASAP